MKKILSLFLVLGLLAWWTAAWAADGDPVLEPITLSEITDVTASAATVNVIDDGLTTQVIVGGGAGVTPVWGTDLPTAITIGTAYIYRVGGTDVVDADVADNITITNLSQVGDVTATAGTVNALDDGLTTQVLVGGGAATTPVWGTDIPTAVTIGTAYIYRVGGTDVADADVVDTLTITAQAGSTWNVADSVTALSVYTGTTSLEETTSATDSGAYIIGVFDEFANSNSTTVQAVLNDLDAAIAAGNPGSFGTGSAQTVAAGIIDASAGANYVIVTGEGDLADTVTEIQGAAVGDVIVFKGKTALAYNITFTDGTYLKLQADFIMNNEADTLTLMLTTLGVNDTFTEISRASNG